MKAVVQLSLSALDLENGHSLRALGEKGTQGGQGDARADGEGHTGCSSRQGHHSYRNDLPAIDRGRKFLLHPIRDTKACWRKPPDQDCGQLVDTSGRRLAIDNAYVPHEVGYLAEDASHRHFAGESGTKRQGNAWQGRQRR
jgi:hypothetical protein